MDNTDSLHIHSSQTQQNTKLQKINSQIYLLLSAYIKTKRKKLNPHNIHLYKFT